MTAATPPAVPRFTLQDRLRKAREQARLTREQLAAITGISSKTIGRYETGHTSPRRPELLAWALATNTDYDWLAGTTRPTRSPAAAALALAGSRAG